MKAQKAKIKGKEGVQSQNGENQRPQAQKLENRPGHGADKFFVWDLGTAGRFWQLAGGGPRSEARSCEGYRPEGSKSHKEQKDTPLKAQKDTKSQRIPPLRAQNAKMDVPKAKMEAEQVK